MGQLQKRFEDQNMSQFQESPEGKVSWKPGSIAAAGLESALPTTPVHSRPVRWQVRALQLGALIIVILSLVLVLG